MMNQSIKNEFSKAVSSASRSPDRLSFHQMSETEQAEFIAERHTLLATQEFSKLINASIKKINDKIIDLSDAPMAIDKYKQQYQSEARNLTDQLEKTSVFEKRLRPATLAAGTLGAVVGGAVSGALTPFAPAIGGYMAAKDTYDPAFGWLAVGGGTILSILTVTVMGAFPPVGVAVLAVGAVTGGVVSAKKTSAFVERQAIARFNEGKTVAGLETKLAENAAKRERLDARLLEVETDLPELRRAKEVLSLLIGAKPTLDELANVRDKIEAIDGAARKMGLLPEPYELRDALNYPSLDSRDRYPQYSSASRYGLALPDHLPPPAPLPSRLLRPEMPYRHQA